MKAVPDTKPETRRLFFGLAPPDAVREQLLALQRELEKTVRGRPTRGANLHLTLVFLGQVAEDRIRCVEQAGDRIHAKGFALHLDQLGYWPRPRVLWAGASQPAPQLAHLVRDLNRLLEPCGHRPDTRPYAPHLTLMRKVARCPRLLPLDAFPSWEVDAFHLLESRPAEGGVTYPVLRSWPLGD
jgi:2'-5' RNA ligase